MNKKFKRLDYWKYKRFKRKPVWRKSRGPKSPFRRGKAGRPPVPKIGYRSPASERGLHPSGLVEVRVFNPAQLEALEPKKHIIRVASAVGGRKRAEIEKLAKQKGIKVIGNANSKKASSKSA